MIDFSSGRGISKSVMAKINYGRVIVETDE